MINSKLPKREKYCLGQSIEKSVLYLLKKLIITKNCSRPLKSAYLLEAQSTLEVIAMKLRLYLELKLGNETQIFQLQAKIQEIGRMLGGWLKSL